MRLNDSGTNNTSNQAYSYQPAEDSTTPDNLFSNVSDIYSRISLISTPANTNSAGNELGIGSSGPQVTALQDSLIEAGYNPGIADGKFGNNTLAAVQDYQQDRIESLENTLRSGPPPAARSELTRQVNELKSDLNNKVAGSETQSQLGLDSSNEVTDRPVEGPGEVEGLQRGDNSAAVESLQEDLNAAGYNSGTPDGAFGPRTEAAVQAFQQDRIDHLKGVQNGPLPPNDHALIDFEVSRLQNELDSGVAGPETRRQLDRVLDSPTIAAPPVEEPPANGPQIGLSEADFQSAADQLGVDVATVKAIAEVESAGAGFLPSGDPSILFEAHIFGDRTGDVYNQSHPNISSASWDRSLYGASGQHQHDRLAQAMALDETAALESASWGQFQIMGFNHEAAGYDNVQDFVAAMRESESNQLDAFVSFVDSHPGMVTALQNKDWASFARQYNGPGYAQNNYDTKIANAYARHSN